VTFLGSAGLRNLIKTKSCITPFDDKRIKQGAYELSLGKEVFLTDSKSGKKEILDEKNCQIEIKPGQFALLLTDEQICIPDDKIAFISIKAGVKLKGLINVSGFHVDPGFKGQLVFSVYNAGPATIILDKGEPYFLIWFSELTEKLDEKDCYNGKHKEQSGIPSKYIEALKSGEVASPNALMEKIKEVESKKNNLDWLFKILIGLLLGIGIKVYWDYDSFEKGKKKGYNESQAQRTLDSTVYLLHEENKVLLLKFDSILRVAEESKKLDNAKK
jgi:dCTP deaminase